MACCNCAKSEAQLEKEKGMLEDKDRKCTDLLCLILFVVFVAGYLGLGIYGIVAGQPLRFVYGTDYEGNLCGDSNSNVAGGVDMSDRPLTIYPRSTEDEILNAGVTDPTQYKLYGICVSECKARGDVVCNNFNSTYSEYAESGEASKVEALKGCVWEAYYSSTPAVSAGLNCEQVRENCWVIGQDTTSTSFRCLPVVSIDNNRTETCTYPGPEELNGQTLSANDPGCLVIKESSDGETERSAQPNLLLEQLSTQRAIWGRYFTDLNRSAPIIFVSAVVVGLVLGFVWLFLLQKLTGVMVWFTVVTVVLVMIGLTLYTYYLAGFLDGVVDATLGELQSQNGTSTYNPAEAAGVSTDAYQYIAYALTALTIILIAVVFALRGSLNTAIAVIEMSATAVAESIDLYLLPPAMLVALTCLLFWFLYVAAALATVGSTQEPSDLSQQVADGNAALADSGDSTSSALYQEAESNAANQTFKSFVTDDASTYTLFAHFFGLLWINQFLQGLSMTIVAMVTGAWYFARPADKEGVKTYTKDRFMCFRATKLVCCNHVGSIAFGSLLIAIVQFIRAVLAYLNEQIKKNGGQNAIMKWIYWAVQSCLGCVEWLIKVVSRNAYVFVAIKGKSYCAAAAAAVSFILGNLSVFAVINAVTGVFFLIGKIIIAAVASFVCYGILLNVDSYKAGGSLEVSSAWLPAFMTLLFGYAVAAAFFGVLDMAIDTILIAFTIDKSENGGHPTHAGADSAVSKTVKGVESGGKSSGTKVTESPAAGAVGAGAAGTA